MIVIYVAGFCGLHNIVWKKRKRFQSFESFIEFFLPIVLSSPIFAQKQKPDKALGALPERQSVTSEIGDANGVDQMVEAVAYLKAWPQTPFTGL